MEKTKSRETDDRKKLGSVWWWALLVLIAALCLSLFIVQWTESPAARCSKQIKMFAS